MPAQTKLTDLNIRPTEYETLLRWSLSFKEVGGLCFGNGYSVKHVERLTNLRDSKDYYAWNKKERSELIESYQARQMNLVAEFHSHSRATHLKTPSPDDTRYFQPNIPHLICFPEEGLIRCWLMSRDRKRTLSSPINLIIERKASRK